ncbi:MAG TPA: protein kinase [Kofleriaceae bacterium]|nr:protein kinase [Kofleriaceae bacterium]
MALAHLEVCGSCRELVSAVCARRTNAEPTREPGRLVAGSMLGHYQIERPLGAGGMGVVYLARDLELDREVAVKLLHSGDDRAHARLARESQALAKLNHPNVVTAHEVGRHGDASYLVMEYVDGGTVRDWLAVTKRRPAEIARVFAEAAHGLAAAHAAGLVHRDVKPDNVLVGSDGRARVSDFGLVGADPTSGVRTTTETQVGVLLGTLRYMAPEVLHGESASAHSDQWSLCASLWESLLGEPPFPGATPLVIADAMEAGLPDPPAELPSWLRRVLIRGMTIDPARRFASLDHLAAALSPTRSTMRRTAIALVAGAAVTAGIAFAFSGHDDPPSCRSDVDDVWGPAQRAAVIAHLDSLGSSGTAILRLVGPKLDAYATRWSGQRAEVCVAEHGDRGGSVPALRAACLDTRRQALGALVSAVRGIDVSSVYAVPKAVEELPTLDDCANVERLVGRQPLPKSLADRMRVVALQQQYATAHVETTLGHGNKTIDRIVDIADAADQLGYHPLVAEALGFVGRAEMALNDQRTLPTMRRAMLAALAGSDDRQIADTAVDVYSGALRIHAPPYERDEARAQADAILQRLRWRHDPIAPIMETYVTSIQGADDFERGRLDAAEIELRRAIKLGTAAMGPRDTRLAPSRHVLGKLLVMRGLPDEAATVLAQSLDFDGVWVQIGGGIDGLSDGAIAVSMLDIATRLYNVGRDDQALELVRQMRRATTAPNTSSMFMLALDDLESEIAFTKGDFEAARRLNDRAAAMLGPDPVPQHTAGIRETRAELEEATGDLVQAERDYRAVLPLVASSHEVDQFVHLSFARCLVKLGKLDEARTILEHEMTKPIMAPRDAPAAWLRLAELRWQHGEHTAAIDAAMIGRAYVAKLPALVADRDALDRWLADHPRQVVSR